jgi:FkbM family methyltransferase
MNLKKINEVFLITKKFGLKHTIKRSIEYIQAIHDTKKKNKIYKKTKPNKEMIKNILNSKMLLSPNDYGIHKELFLDGIREPIATKFIQQILKKEDVVLEIGANLGYYALIEAKKCKKIYAIVPAPKNIISLKKNIKLNNYKNIKVYNMALGDENKMAKMYLSSKCNWHSFYKQSGNEVIEIKMSTTDNFLEKKEKPNFLRMDVEGYEYNIIKGMKKTLEYINRMFIELHSDIMKEEETQELLDTLKKQNFIPELIIHYDRPGLSKILPNEYLKTIYNGDKGNYEIFFKKI